MRADPAEVITCLDSCWTIESAQQNERSLIVIPAKAGIQSPQQNEQSLIVIPAKAGIQSPQQNEQSLIVIPAKAGIQNVAPRLDRTSTFPVSGERKRE